MKILLAIDDSKYSEAAIRAVIAQFPPQGSEVRVLHAVEWMKDVTMSIAFAEGPAAARDVLTLRDQAIHDAGILAAKAAERLRSAGFAATTMVPEGEPRDTILDCAAEWHPDLIVLGSHGRRGMDRFLLGSVSEGVVRHASCSVEIVRAN